MRGLEMPQVATGSAIEKLSYELGSDHVTVYLVAENRLLREALLRVLQKRSDLAVAGHTDSPEIAAHDIAVNPCHVLLIDSLQMLCSMSLNAPPTRQPESNPLKVVLFGMNEDREIFLESVRAGVTAYLLKDASAADVIDAIRRVARGEAVCPPRLCFALFQSFVGQTRQPNNPPVLDAKYNLTRRQHELIELLFQKLTNKEIASRLNLSEFTVKNHVRRIIRQLEAANRYEAVEMMRAIGYFNCA
jgi:DNA-binding NarL/FixJ family response regulator